MLCIWGLFWQKMQSLFPITEEHPPLPEVIERFPEGLSRRSIKFEAVEESIMPRLWLLNRVGTELIQIQNNRFIKNWRKVAEKDQYPHYEPVIKPAFERDFQEFQTFVRDEGLGQIKVNQCEVTYVDHIVSGDGWDELGDLDGIFSFWKV